MPDTGHLFVCHADLTRLACDAVVTPCDETAMFRAAWEPFMPEGTVAVFDGWKRLPSARLTDGHTSLTGRTGTITELVVTDSFTDVAKLVARVVEAVSRAAERARSGEGRALPLVALPLVGTGAGGLAHRRGAVIDQLLPSLEDLVARHAFDVALVLHDPRDHAAVQARRSADTSFREIEAHLSHADRLGELAGNGGLSLFVGSGVSIPLGMPSWEALLRTLNGDRDIPDGPDLLTIADQILSDLEEDDYRAQMMGIFSRDQHALSHALLAGLGVRQMITTNYDPCLELALDRVHGDDGYRVMTRSLAEGDKPWLLKLHGDIKRPDSLVLTGSDYARLAREHGALHGVVESLLLTSHLLFVGFGLRDDDYVKLAQGVAATRSLAEKDGEHPPVGTALGLAPTIDDKAHLDGLAEVTMSSREDPAAARLVEIVLDRVLMQATRAGAGSTTYFLDERFSEAFATDADQRLRSHLLAIARDRSTMGSSARDVVDRLLLALGLSADELPRTTPTGEEETVRPKDRGPWS